ncbi:oligosaccharide flippase family protein [Methylomonas paludis]|uniref:Oligosaccharide flippase family protein n=1 Tax=Methylomonas paludis TaxID=1173101 RepID=A0A975MPS4_9GAMM|nr:oligosaccharide flippase family protein [Methylomonas paludis]QWF71695.1 oligosaccharide flippase family protein [Methylomonas paludis]
MSATAYSHQALKKSGLQFLVGKLSSSLLTIGILVWLVRLLDIAEYGYYVTFVAGLEFALAVIAFGLPWLTSRYIPEYRLHAQGAQLLKFVCRILLCIVLSSSLGSLALYFTMPWLLPLLDMSSLLELARLYLLVLVMEGLRRNLQECILEPLLQQGYAQFSQVIRSIVLLLVMAGILLYQGKVTLYDAILAEFAGTVVGSISALYGLIVFLRKNRHQPGKEGWQQPHWVTIWQTALHMYLSHLITMLCSRQVYIFLIQRFLGVEATAIFGFLFNLYGQICRYLPSHLLFSLIRPKLIASYVSDEGSIQQLNANANLVGKISLFVLLPILAYIWLTGTELLELLSGGKVKASGWYFACLLLTLIPLSQRPILQTVLVACHKSSVCTWASLVSICTLPLAYWLLISNFGMWSVIIAMICSETLYNSILVISITYSADYKTDLTGNLRLFATAISTYLLCAAAKILWLSAPQLTQENFQAWRQAPTPPDLNYLSGLLNTAPANPWLYLLVTAILVAGLFLFIGYLIKPFQAVERAKINKALHRNIFVW